MREAFPCEKRSLRSDQTSAAVSAYITLLASSGLMELRIQDKIMSLQRLQRGYFTSDGEGGLMDPSMKPILFFALRLILMARLQVP